MNAVPCRVSQSLNIFVSCRKHLLCVCSTTDSLTKMVVTTSPVRSYVFNCAAIEEAVPGRRAEGDPLFSLSQSPRCRESGVRGVRLSAFESAQRRLLSCVVCSSAKAGNSGRTGARGGNSYWGHQRASFSRVCVCMCVCGTQSSAVFQKKKKKRLSLREHSRRRCYRDSTSLAHKTCHRWLPELFRQRLTQVPVDRVMHQSVVWPFVFPAGTVESQCGAKAVRLSPSSCACGSLWELISSGVEACRQGSPGPNLETFATQQTTDDERQTWKLWKPKTWTFRWKMQVSLKDSIGRTQRAEVSVFTIACLYWSSQTFVHSFVLSEIFNELYKVEFFVHCGSISAVRVDRS